MKLWEIIICAFVFIFGSTLSWYAYHYEIESQKQKMQFRFERAANERVIVLTGKFDEAFQMLQSLAGLYAASEEVTVTEIKIFVDPLLKIHPGIVEFGWAPRVMEKNRAAFTNNMQKDIPGYTIFSYNNKDQKIPAPNAAIYYPITYLVTKRQVNAIGYNLFNILFVKNAIELAINENQEIVLDSFTLVQKEQEEKSKGFMILKPLPKDQSVLFSTCTYSGMFETVHALTKPAGLDIELINPNDGKDEVIYTHFSRNHNTVHRNSTPLFTLTVPLKLANHNWILKVTSTPSMETYSLQPYYDLVMLLGITILLDVCLIMGFLYENKRAVEAARKKDFFDVLSHEIRTPIHSLLGYINQLQETKISQLDSDAQHYLSRAIASAKLLVTIVNNAIAFSKKGKMRISSEPIDYNLTETIKEVCHLAASLARENAVDLSVDFPHQTILSRGDQKMISYSLYNLVVNAIFHGRKGKVKISAKQVMCDFIIMIQDSGSGIPKDEIPYLFDPYFQGSKKRTHGQGGRGLGLAVAHLVIVEHLGKIEVASELGKGTTLTVHLPVVSNEECAPKEQSH